MLVLRVNRTARINGSKTYPCEKAGTYQYSQNQGYKATVIIHSGISSFLVLYNIKRLRGAKCNMILS